MVSNSAHSILEACAQMKPEAGGCSCTHEIHVSLTLMMLTHGAVMGS